MEDKTDIEEFFDNMTANDHDWFDYFHNKYTKEEMIAKYILLKRRSL